MRVAVTVRIMTVGVRMRMRMGVYGFRWGSWYGGVDRGIWCRGCREMFMEMAIAMSALGWMVVL